MQGFVRIRFENEDAGLKARRYIKTLRPPLAELSTQLRGDFGGRLGGMFRLFGKLHDSMNREGRMQHLIARCKFIPLGARLDSKKHAA